MASAALTLLALQGIPLVEPGDDLGAILIAAIVRSALAPRDQDVLVVAQKIVSKAEGRLRRLAEIVPSARAKALAAEVNKDPRFVELVLSEASEVVRHRRDVLVVAHRLGLVMANAGIDQSNVAHGAGDEHVLLLPEDPDASAAALKARLDAHFGVDLGIVINDSFGRAWRHGVTGVAIGAAGLPSLINMIGEPDLFGRALKVTQIAFADEIAAAASLIMGQAAEGRPAVLARGLAWRKDAARAAEALIRPKEMDLFR